MMMSLIPGNVPGPSNPEAAGMKKKNAGNLTIFY